MQCEICGHSDRRMVNDHDHRTGYVRGILCFRCNNALGLFDERLDVLIAALTYLQRPQQPDARLYADVKRALGAANQRKQRTQPAVRERERLAAKATHAKRQAIDPDYRKAQSDRAARWNRTHDYKHQRAQKERLRIMGKSA